eukprot:TRINITY_DN2454_c0_g3_i1.p2 TRINITY_DN2454_c0_g3~~TRINITY_DN2454_c0_g3_i1.p2  ORF type:complete len:278 (+),score=41.68 TRINITY_DN2454_c0_g3_i1:110-943(+)
MVGGVDLSWALPGSVPNLRVRVMKGLGTASASVGVAHLRTCVVGAGAACDVLVAGEGIASEHCAVGGDLHGTCYVVALVHGGVALRHVDAATSNVLEVGRPTAVRWDDTIQLAGCVGAGVALRVAGGEEGEDEIVLPPATWNNTVANSLRVEAAAAAAYDAQSGRKRQRWTGSLAKKEVTFAAALVEYDTDRRRPSTPPPLKIQKPSPPPPCGRASPPPRPPSPDPGGVPRVAPRLSPPAKRIRRNLFAWHPPIPPAERTAAAFDAFPAFIVEEKGL